MKYLSCLCSQTFIFYLGGGWLTSFHRMYQWLIHKWNTHSLLHYKDKSSLILWFGNGFPIPLLFFLSPFVLFCFICFNHFLFKIRGPFSSQVFLLNQWAVFRTKYRFLRSRRLCLPFQTRALYVGGSMTERTQSLSQQNLELKCSPVTENLWE